MLQIEGTKSTTHLDNPDAYSGGVSSKQRAGDSSDGMKHLRSNRHGSNATS
jgi:hypothetical protein